MVLSSPRRVSIMSLRQLVLPTGSRPNNQSGRKDSTRDSCPSRSCQQARDKGKKNLNQTNRFPVGWPGLKLPRTVTMINMGRSVSSKPSLPPAAESVNEKQCSVEWRLLRLAVFLTRRLRNRGDPYGWQVKPEGAELFDTPAWKRAGRIVGSRIELAELAHVGRKVLATRLEQLDKLDRCHVLATRQARLAGPGLQRMKTVIDQLVMAPAYCLAAGKRIGNFGKRSRRQGRDCCRRCLVVFFWEGP